MVAVRRSSLADAMTTDQSKRQTVQFFFRAIEESFPIFGNLYLACYSGLNPLPRFSLVAFLYLFYNRHHLDDVDSSIFNALLSYIIRHDNSLSIISKGG